MLLLVYLAFKINNQDLVLAVVRWGNIQCTRKICDSKYVRRTENNYDLLAV